MVDSMLHKTMAYMTRDSESLAVAITATPCQNYVHIGRGPELLACL